MYYLSGSNPIDTLTEVATLPASIRTFVERPWGLYIVGVGAVMAVALIASSGVMGKIIGSEVRKELRKS